MKSVDIKLLEAIASGVLAAVLAGLFALWRIYVTHRRSLELQRKNHRNDLARDIYEDIARHIEAAISSLSDASSYALGVTQKFGTAPGEVLLKQIKRVREGKPIEAQLPLTVAIAAEKGDIGLMFEDLHHKANQSVLDDDGVIIPLEAGGSFFCSQVGSPHLGAEIKAHETGLLTTILIDLVTSRMQRKNEHSSIWRAPKQRDLAGNYRV